MRRSFWYRFVVLAAAGGTLFQATTSCADQLLSTVVTSLAPVLTSALTDAITNALLGGTAV